MATRQTQLVAGSDLLSCGAILWTRLVRSSSWWFMGHRWISFGTTGTSYGGVLLGLALNEVWGRLCEMLRDSTRTGQCLARSCITMMLYWLPWNIWSRGKRIRNVTKWCYTLNLDNLFFQFPRKATWHCGLKQGSYSVAMDEWNNARCFADSCVILGRDSTFFLRVRDLFKPMISAMSVMIVVVYF